MLDILFLDVPFCFRFGFVTYSNLDEVEECLKSGPHVIDGRQVDVKRAVPKESGQENSFGSPKSKKVCVFFNF